MCGIQIPLRYGSNDASKVQFDWVVVVDLYRQGLGISPRQYLGGWGGIDANPVIWVARYLR